MQSKVPVPFHGDSQTTEKGNLLICMEKPDKPGKFFFYMTPSGDYLVSDYTKNTGLLPNKTEWNFLFEKTKKVSKLNEDCLRIAEDLIAYIVQDPKNPWKISEVREMMALLAKGSNQNQSSFTKVKGFDKLASIFAIQQ